MINWGKVPLASVLPFIFDSFDGGTGASITLTGLALADILVYKGTSMIQRASTAGFVLLDTDGIDIDTTTGIHGFSIDTSDNTDAGFFAAGSFYTVVVSSVTIDAQTVSFVAGTFHLGPTLTVAGVDEVDVTHVAGTAQTAGDLKNDLNTLLTRIPTLVKADMETVINAYEPAKISVSGRLFDVSANGNVGIDWNNIDNPTTTQNLSGTTVSAVSGATGSVTGNVGGDVLGSVVALGVNAINNNSIHSNACAKISDSGIQRGASNWENNSDDRSLAWAISKLVNKVDLNAAGDTLTIRKSNDSTALFTQAVTTSGGAAPVVSLDTAG